MLLDPTGLLTIRPARMFRNLSWFVHFLSECCPSRKRHWPSGWCTRRHSAILADSKDLGRRNGRPVPPVGPKQSTFPAENGGFAAVPVALLDVLAPVYLLFSAAEADR